jgi:integrase
VDKDGNRTIIVIDPATGGVKSSTTIPARPPTPEPPQPAPSPCGVMSIAVEHGRFLLTANSLITRTLYRRQKKQAPNKKLKKNKRASTNVTIKPATVNRELAYLRCMMNYFVRKDVLVKNPVSRVKFFKEDNEQMRVVSVDEERHYLMACNQPLRDFATLMIETGARPSELSALEWSNVHLNKDHIVIPRGKTKAARRKIPLTSRAAEILRRRLGHRKGDFVFPGTRGGDDGSKPILKLNNAHHGALKRSGVAPFRLYDLRHTFATRAAEAGVDIMTLAALLGHSRIQMVMRYAHPIEEHQFNAIRKMEEHRAPKSAPPTRGISLNS